MGEDPGKRHSARSAKAQTILSGRQREGTWSLPNSSIYGCKRENLHASPQAVESCFLQTAPVYEVWKNSKSRPNESQWRLLPNMPGCLSGADHASLQAHIL